MAEAGIWKWAVAAVAVWAGTAGAESARVRIESEFVSADREYLYRVVNESTQPVVSITIPHYRADLFVVPPGWVSEATNLVGQGGADKPGTCTAKAEPPNPGLAAGSVLALRMRVPDASVWSGTGEARVKFADGSETVIPGVKMPVSSSGERGWVLPVGLAILFVIAIGVRELRKRRPRAGAVSPGEGA